MSWGRSKESRDGGRTPIIALTAWKRRHEGTTDFSDPESRIMKGGDGFLQGYNAQAAVEGVCQLIAGMDDYVTKPIRGKLLREAIDRVLSSR